MTQYDDVGAFHSKFGLPHRGDGSPPALLDQDTNAFRYKFMHEELDEYKKAWEEKDLAGAADALVDLCYVLMGTAQMMSLPFDECFAAVHKANMTKVRASGSDDPLSTRGHRLDVVKGPDFRPPDLGPIIEDARRET
jgi:hypothetical protein